ncbi:hypothetical protein EJ06DRAFT_17360 [Trichodelitschia bisporula]|uniref:Glutamyl-tRNA amidotransferase complex subunit Gta3 domain-containing protein n=1 Tax=Trichodelitschia bisporula TaxID=703511 RepID=A0A6G1IB65_9PEZI|nr:hypothetical protein EJ06DRAFT_17360 [Trichodelitschia bisporula]
MLGLRIHRSTGNGLGPARLVARHFTSCHLAPFPSDGRHIQDQADLAVATGLSEPTWSVSSLLPADEASSGSHVVFPEQLRHLLRLSALPQPKGTEEEVSMIRSLASQLHFIREIQKVDTVGVEPLLSIRDETAASDREREINLETLNEILENEEIIGKHHKRIRRHPVSTLDTSRPEAWRPLDHAQSHVGKYFAVDSLPTQTESS